MYRFVERFTEDIEEFFEDARKLGETKIDSADDKWGCIDIKTNDLDGLVAFIKKWYDPNNDGSYGIITETEPLKKYVAISQL